MNISVRVLPLLLFALTLAACTDRHSGSPVSESAAASAASVSTSSFLAGVTSIDDVPVDLDALVGAVADNPNQFAVNVPHGATPETAGLWSDEGGMQVWTYAVRIRGAVSLSFHAPRVQLPPGAMLTVVSAFTTTSYGRDDIGRGDLWSRIQPGDTLEFRLQVPAADRAQLAFEISSFQAGFRGLSPAVRDSASLSRSRSFKIGDPDTPCVQNYACNVTSGNSPPAQATVALTIGNMFLCTGTLINNTAQDNTPYILTARHCQNGNYGGAGGTPSVASSVTVYWDALTACGTDLGSVYYTPGSARQSGATTVVEQQDAWLIKLDASPVVNDAQYAGFDATAAPPDGGYTIHHALGYNKQITGWFGTAYPRSAAGVLGAAFVSDLLDTVNDFGVIGPGASGAALFSSSDRLVGVLSLGRNRASVSGYGSCPAAVPNPPNAGNGEASFVSFAAIWNSTADTTSSTGTRSLRSVLDPGGTGALGVASMPAARLNLTASQYSASWNTTVTLSWSAANATQCTASGGSSADGWAGSLPGSGSRDVTESTTADTTYKLKCDLAGGGSVTGSLVVSWQPPQAQPRFNVFRSYFWTTRPVELAWQSVIGPCAISGGGVSRTGLPASGSLTTTSASPADITYLLTCGVPGFTQTTQTTISYVTPNVYFAVSGTRRKLGQQLQLAWYSFADSCFPTGGAPSDTWATRPTQISQGTYSTQTQDMGTFTYALTCTAGAISVQKSVQVTVDDAAPFVTLTPQSSSVVLSNTPAGYIHIGYITNIGSCSWNEGGFPQRSIIPAYQPNEITSLTYSEGDRVVAPAATGTYTAVVTCLGWPLAQAGPVTATTSVAVLPPAAATATVSSSANQVPNLGSFTITWSSTNASNCTATSDGAPENAAFWRGSVGASGSHLVQVASNVSEDAVYSISCPSIDPAQPAATASTFVTIGSPGLGLTNTTLNPAMGTSFTLSWNEPTATSCRASGGGANGTPWTGPLAINGSATQTASVAGTFTYTLTCVFNGTSRQSTSVVTVSATSAGGGSPGGGTSGGSSSSTGGGGAFGLREFMFLLLLYALRSRRGTAAR